MMVDREKLDAVLNETLDKLEGLNRNLTIYEIMEKTGKSRQTIYDWMAKGLPVSRSGGELRFSWTEVEEFLENRDREQQRRKQVIRKGIAIDKDLRDRMLAMTSGKWIVNLLERAIRKGIENYEQHAQMDYGGTNDAIVYVDKRLAKSLSLISINDEKYLYKVSNAIIRSGLDTLESDTEGH